MKFENIKLYLTGIFAHKYQLNYLPKMFVF